MARSAIVIGAGISGLATAAFLAQDGWDVIVLEKNATPGGRARQFSDSGFTFDMGPSWYWMPDVFERFFNKFGKSVSDFYKLQRIDPSYRVFWEKDSTDLPADFNQLKNVFEQIEPNSGKSLESYLSEAQKKYKIGMLDLAYKPGQSITEFLNWQVIKSIPKLQIFSSVKTHISKYFKSKKIQQLMQFPMLFLGALPENTPALYSLMNYADIKGGTWYPEGGMYSIVKAMKDLCDGLGVQFHFDAAATEIVVDHNRMNKIKTSTGSFSADVVISSVDYHFTEMQLLAPQFRSYSEKYWNNRVLAPSCLIYYVGLNTKIEGLLHHSLFFDVPFDDHASEIYKDPKWPKSPLFYMCAPSVTDKSVAPDGCENLFLLIPIAAGLKNDSDEIREQYFQDIISRVEKRTNQNITAHVIYKRSYSVSDFTHDYNAFKGNAYGLANTLMQTAILKPSCRSKKVENLFYTGQFTVPGPGVPPALISGEIVAREVIKYYNKTS